MPNFGNPMLLAWQWFIRASCLEERSERRALSSKTSFRVWSCCITFSGIWLPLISFSLRFLGFGPAKRAALLPLPTTEILIQWKIMTYLQSRMFFWVHPNLIDGGDVGVRGRQQPLLSAIHRLLPELSKLIFSEWGTDLLLKDQKLIYERLKWVGRNENTLLICHSY